MQEELFALAPEWFKRDDIRVSLMYFGFECGDGWYKLLERLIIDLKEVAPKGFEVCQVKEKYGALRFYVSGSTETTDHLIQLAEAASQKICERCGKRGKTRGTGWLVTLCNTCQKEREEKKKNDH
jgi:hypothetical protein